jgi:hypothetical protein
MKPIAKYVLIYFHLIHFLFRTGLKQGDTLSPMLFNFTLEYANRKGHVGLELNGTHQLLVYADDINLLGDSINTIQENLGGGGIFLFTTASRTALESTQPPIQWEPGALSLGVKWPGREADHSPPSSAEVKE